MLQASYDVPLNLQRIDDSSRSDSSCMTMIYHIDYINAFCHNVNDMLQIDSILSN